jgi:hypothetical protein
MIQATYQQGRRYYAPFKHCDKIYQDTRLMTMGDGSYNRRCGKQICYHVMSDTLYDAVAVHYLSEIATAPSCTMI